MKAKLPIDVVPNTSPPKFRWQHRTDSLVGPRVVECEGALPASAEQAVADLVGMTKELVAKADALQKFKDWVHAYLDAQGVPKEFPDGEHTKRGCRIGDRMDWLVGQLREAQSRVEGLAERVAAQSDLLSKKAEAQQGSSLKKGKEAAK